MADRLPHRDEQIIDLDPVLLWEFCAQRHFCLIRSFGFDVAPAVGNAMHMCVYTNAEFLVPLRHDEICGFPTNAFELH